MGAVCFGRAFRRHDPLVAVGPARAAAARRSARVEPRASRHMLDNAKLAAYL